MNLLKEMRPEEHIATAKLIINCKNCIENLLIWTFVKTLLLEFISM